jgi:transcriptional regulator with XRE-family HTH domain
LDTIGDRLKKIRAYFNYNQSDFAKKLNIERNSLSDKERDKSNLSIKTTIVLISDLNISIDWLLTGTGRMFNNERLEDYEKILNSQKMNHQQQINNGDGSNNIQIISSQENEIETLKELVKSKDKIISMLEKQIELLKK